MPITDYPPAARRTPHVADCQKIKANDRVKSFQNFKKKVKFDIDYFKAL